MSRATRGAAPLAAFPSFVMLSQTEDLTAAQRTKIRNALREPVAQLVHDLSLIQGAVEGPDPEWALYLSLDVLRDLAPTLAAIEAKLSKVLAATPAAAVALAVAP